MLDWWKDHYCIDYIVVLCRCNHWPGNNAVQTLHDWFSVWRVCIQNVPAIGTDFSALCWLANYVSVCTEMRLSCSPVIDKLDWRKNRYSFFIPLYFIVLYKDLWSPFHDSTIKLVFQCFLLHTWLNYESQHLISQFIQRLMRPMVKNLPTVTDTSGIHNKRGNVRTV